MIATKRDKKNYSKYLISKKNISPIFRKKKYYLSNKKNALLVIFKNCWYIFTHLILNQSSSQKSLFVLQKTQPLLMYTPDFQTKLAYMSSNMQLFSLVECRWLPTVLTRQVCAKRLLKILLQMQMGQNMRTTIRECLKWNARQV